MTKYVIKGGKKLIGETCVSSAKNAVLPIIAAATLTDEDVTIKDCPKIADVFCMIKILESVGAAVSFKNGDLTISAKSIDRFSVKSDLCGKLRSSIYMLGALFPRFKNVCVAYPGGCNIGKRPIDIHLNVVKSFGGDVDERDNGAFCRAEKLVGADVTLCFPSVGATENALMLASLARGDSIIRNAAREPEVKDLADFLNSMGAKIKGAGEKTVYVTGVKKLHGTVYKPIPDRIEAGTFLLAAAIAGGEIAVRGARAQNIVPLLDKLRQNACNLSVENDIIHIKSGIRRKPFSLVTGPYPSFPTDLQAQTLVLAALSEGESVIRENIFENRFSVAEELRRMGADVKVYGNAAIVNGVKSLYGGVVGASDLRGGAALCLAGLAAEGETVVLNARHIERGYAAFTEKLGSLGADIAVAED